MEDYYTIQTPEHHSTLFTQLHALQKQGVMCDVILAAEDGEVMAHKVILMAVSKYFREKLSPVISATATRVFLKGIPVIELANLVKYIYTGKLLIAKDTMDITLEVAEILQLNGVINGYKEILAYEQLKGHPARENSVVTFIKPDKDNARYDEFNVQVEQYTEGQEQDVAEANQKLAAAGFTDGAGLDVDGSTIVTEHGGSVQTTTHNTSTEFAFETDLFEDQYYDVSVGSTVAVQSENQINSMPSLQKMTNTMSAEENEAQHQDLLSVAIETLTDANYLSSPPGKEHRHMFNSIPHSAISYNNSMSTAETVSVSSQPTEPVSAIPTPADMLTDATVSAQDKGVSYTQIPGDAIPHSHSVSKGVKGQVPVYRVSLPPTVAIYPEPLQQKGRPRKSESDKKKWQPKKSPTEVKISPTTRASRAGKMIVSPQLTKSNQKKKETPVKTPESKRKLTVAKNQVSKDVVKQNEFDKVSRKTNSHLNKVVNDLRTQVTERVEDFGQSVNFDSDDDNDACEEIHINGDIEETSEKTNVEPKSSNNSMKQVKEVKFKTPDHKESNENKVATSELEKTSQKTTPKANQKSRESDLSKQSTESKKVDEKSNENTPRRKETKAKKQPLKGDSNNKTIPVSTTKEQNEDLNKLKTPKGKNQFIIEIDNAEVGTDSSNIKDIRSSASKRKCKPPRRLTGSENTKTKSSMNENIPMVRTRRYSKNEGSQDEKTVSNGLTTVVKKSNNKIEISTSKKSKDLEKEKRDPTKSMSATDSVNEKEASKVGKQNLQPVVKLAKQSKEQIMNMAREIAASKSPRKRKLEKVEVEIEQNDIMEVVKKKRKQPTELPPVAALKNRQKTDVDDDNDDGDDDDDDDGNISKDSIDGTPLHDSHQIKCRKCNQSFRYRMQLNKHSKVCKGVNSSNKKDRNLFDDLQGDAVDHEFMVVEERSRSGTPESENCITVEVIPFDQNDGEHLKQMSKTDKGKTTKDRLYICSEQDCKFSTESSFAAAKHRNRHEAKFTCDDCGIIFSTRKRFKDHECNLLCDTCDVMFETKKDLSAHMKEHIVDGKGTPKVKKEKKENQSWPCLICGELFTSQKGRRAHEKTHELVCTCCNIKFTKVRNYKIHLSTQKRKSTELMCFICNHPFSRRGDQRKHMFKFHGVPLEDGKKDIKMFQCEICSFVAWSERTFSLHKKAHTGVKDVPCPKCNKMFMSQYDVNRHIKGVHSNVRERFKCNHEGCPYQAYTKKCLQTHIKLRHDVEKLFLLCQFCEYKSQLKGNLDKHIRKVHNLEVVSKPYLKDTEKYGELKHGTIISKDGKEIMEDDVENYRRPLRRSTSESIEKEKVPKKGRRPKTIEQFTQEIMAKHMRRLESPSVEKDYLSPTLQKAIDQPGFPQASVTVRRDTLAEKGIVSAPRFLLQYDKMDEHEAHQYAIKDEMVGLEQEVIVDDGIVPIPSTGMSVGNEVYIIEAGKSDNVIESPDFVQNFVDEYEDETSRSLRVLTNNNENEDETTRSLRVLTTLLEAGQH